MSIVGFGQRVAKIFSDTSSFFGSCLFTKQNKLDVSLLKSNNFKPRSVLFLSLPPSLRSIP